MDDIEKIENLDEDLKRADELIASVKKLVIDTVDELPRKSLKTGFIYYERMTEHECLWDKNYEENPKRFSQTFKKIKELNLLERCEILEPRQALEEEILRIHTKEYYDKIKATENVEDENILEEISSEFDAVYFHPKTYELAMYSAGCTIELIESVCTDQIKNGFALIRPPGHHAMSNEACGYCFFNNVAIAANYAINQLGIQRILIVDWDVHHGQATQYSFYDDPNVLYFSIHRYEKGAFWPELIESNYNFVGGEQAKGFNINVPLNEIGMENGDYLSIWHNLLLPVAYEFNPELVIISAGFDAAIGCPEGEMRITPACFAHLCHLLMGLANGKICVVLEGGYCIESLAESAALTLRTLLGDPCPTINNIFPLKTSLIESVLDVIWAQRPFWKCLQLQGKFSRHEKEGDDDQEQFGQRHLPFLEYKGKMALIDKPEKYPTRNCYPVQSDETKQNLKLEIEKLIQNTDLSVKFDREFRTCIAFDEGMTKHKCIRSHPERPNRIKEIFKLLKNKNLLEKCKLLHPRYASENELLFVHTQEHINKLKETQTMDQEKLELLESEYDSIYLTNQTYLAATLACGSLLEVVDNVMSDKFLNGFACIRPPGHHADAEKPAGFCIFNNVAVAVKYAMQKYSLKRILIVDWDVHHGDGTQKIFENNENVLYVSLHRYDFASFYPSTIESGYNRAKNIINIPWNGGPMSDWEYLLAFTNVILPVAYNFNPELIFISSGFDAANGDPLGQYCLSANAYGHFTHFLMSLARGKVIIALEGGYNLNSISLAASQCVSVLIGNPPLPLKLGKIDKEAIQTLRSVINYHSTNWECFKFNYDLPDNNLSI